MWKFLCRVFSSLPLVLHSHLNQHYSSKHPDMLFPISFLCGSGSITSTCRGASNSDKAVFTSLHGRRIKPVWTSSGGLETDLRNKYPQKVINNLNPDLSSKHKWDDKERWAFWSVVLGQEEGASVQWMACGSCLSSKVSFPPRHIYL